MALQRTNTTEKKIIFYEKPFPTPSIGNEFPYNYRKVSSFFWFSSKKSGRIGHEILNVLEKLYHFHIFIHRKNCRKNMPRQSLNGNLIFCVCLPKKKKQRWQYSFWFSLKKNYIISIILQFLLFFSNRISRTALRKQRLQALVDCKCSPSLISTAFLYSNHYMI